MKIKLNEKYLITTDSWFRAPNGSQCKAVFGTVTAIEDDDSVLGIRTNRNATNWYLVIGNMIVAGCQIHYAIQTDSCSTMPDITDVEHDGKLIRQEHTNSSIYFADE